MNRKQLAQKLESFISKYQGKQVGYPTDSSFKGECLSIAKRYINEVFEIAAPPSGSNSAYGYWSNFPDPLPDVFEKVPKNGDIPLVGDIPIWNTKTGNGYGHIDIFVSGDQNMFIGFDQNWNGREGHLQTHDYKNVVGWLRPKDIELEDMPSWLKTMFIEIGIDLGKPESEIRHLVQDVIDASKKDAEKEKRIHDLEKKCEGLAEEAAGNEERLLQIEQSRARLEEEVNDLKRSISNKNTEIQKLNEQIDRLIKESVTPTPQPKPKPNKLSRFIRWILRR